MTSWPQQEHEHGIETAMTVTTMMMKRGEHA